MKVEGSATLTVACAFAFPTIGEGSGLDWLMCEGRQLLLAPLGMVAECAAWTSLGEARGGASGL